MATISLTWTLPTGVTAIDLNNMLALEYNYQANIPDPANPGQTIPNPETSAAFVKRQIGRIQMEAYRRQKDAAAVAAARAALPIVGDLT